MTLKKAVIFLAKEEFRDIPGYEGMYQISNKGTIISFIAGKKPIIRQHNICGEHYQHYIALSKDKVVKRLSVARIMAQVFDLPNPHGYDYVGFKDGNQDNLDISNLEWKKRDNPWSHTPEIEAKRSKTWAEKMKDGYRRKAKDFEKRNRRVTAYDDDGFVATFRSIAIASELTGASNIGQALRVGCKSGGYFWKYAD